MHTMTNTKPTQTISIEDRGDSVSKALVVFWIIALCMGTFDLVFGGDHTDHIVVYDAFRLCDRIHFAPHRNASFCQIPVDGGWMYLFIHHQTADP
jgi:hypothetical protein